MITPELWANALTYADYRTKVDTLYAAGKGSEYDEKMNTPEILHYVELNIHRMKRLDKTAKLLPEVEAKIDQMAPQKWLILTEGWCGDASQIVPVMQKIADNSNGKIEARYLLRDEHTDLMDLYLTNGGRAIPKLIKLNADTLEVLGDWGPRPVAAQALVDDYKRQSKENPKSVSFEDIKTAIHKWYADNKTVDTQREIFGIF